MQDACHIWTLKCALLTIKSLWLSGRASEHRIQRSEVWFLMGTPTLDKTKKTSSSISLQSSTLTTIFLILFTICRTCLLIKISLCVIKQWTHHHHNVQRIGQKWWWKCNDDCGEDEMTRFTTALSHIIVERRFLWDLRQTEKNCMVSC